MGKGGWTMATIGGGIVSAAAVVAALNAFGYHLPRPAWDTELMEVAGQTVENRKAILRSELRFWDARVWDLRARVDRYVASGQTPPTELIQELRASERSVRDIEDELRRLP